MAKKKITALIKLQCPAGKATPAPPVGPALGPHGVSAPKFVQEFNDRTKSMEIGLTIPVVITVFSDKTFTFILKTPPCIRSYQEGMQSSEGFGKCRNPQGSDPFEGKARRNCQDQDARYQCKRYRSSQEDYCRYCSQYGCRGGAII